MTPGSTETPETVQSVSATCNTSPGAPQEPAEPPVMIRRPSGAYRKAPNHGKHGPIRKRGLRGAQTGAGQELPAAQMAAAGIGVPRIAEALGISESATKTILQRPHVQEYVQQVREATRHITLATVQHAQIQVGQWLQDTIADRDPRAFDAITRGMHALEKTSASASGETRPQTQIAVIHTDAAAEGKQLLRALMGLEDVEAG